MQYRTLISPILLVCFFTINAAGQARSKSSSSTTATKEQQPYSEAEQKMADADSTVATSKRMLEKAKTTFKDVFGSKEPGEAAVIIDKIEFDDDNLQLLESAIKDRKEVKKASTEYDNGTATIRIILRGKSEADFWNDLPKELKEVFRLKNKKENIIHVEYRKKVSMLASN